jgi:hypothetical protein
MLLENKQHNEPPEHLQSSSVYPSSSSLPQHNFLAKAETCSKILETTVAFFFSIFHAVVGRLEGDDFLVEMASPPQYHSFPSQRREQNFLLLKILPPPRPRPVFA